MPTATKSRTTSLARVQARPVPVRTRTIIAAPAPRRRSSLARSGSSGIMGTPITGQRAVIAYALGAAQREGRLARVPTFMQLSAEATIALGAHFLGGSSPLAKDVTLVAGLVALNQMGREGLVGAHAAAGVGAKDPYEVQGDPEND